jgi:cytochrome c-type biogenesis protein CcmF
MFLKKIMQSLIASLLLTVAFAWGLGMTNPLYIFLLFTSSFAILGNLDYWLRVARGMTGVSASSIAHIGFGLIILGALISNANKKIISQNRLFIHEEFPANENLLVELNDTVQMKPYWVTFAGEEFGTGSESHYNYYNLEFYKENKDSSLEYQFTLRPSIQKNERMGNVPEPSTKHYLNRDVYTHITYADLRPEEEKNSEWKDEAEMRMEPGAEGQLVYNKYLVTLDSVVADVQQAPDGSGFNYIVLGASLSVQGLADTVVKVTPLYIVQNNEASSMDAVLDDFGLKFSFTGIDHGENKPIVKVWRKRAEEQPFIIVQAIVFPMINLLWLGCVLMAIGTMIAVWQRIRPKTKTA